MKDHSLLMSPKFSPKLTPFPYVMQKWLFYFLSGITKSGDPPPVDDIILNAPFLKLLSSLIAFYVLRILQTKLKKKILNFLC